METVDRGHKSESMVESQTIVTPFFVKNELNLPNISL